jgi:hypothetical protein
MRTGAGEGALAIDTEMGGMAQADGGPDGANDNDASIPVSEDVPISGTGSDLPASDEGDDDNDNEDSDEDPPSEAGPPSDDDGDVYKDRSRPSKGLVLRARTQHKKGKLRMKKKFHTLTKKPPPLRQASPDTPLERGYLNFGPEVDDAAERKRNRDRMRTKQRNLKKQIAANLPPPPPLLPSKVPKDTQLNTNFVTLIGSAILAHPLRHAPVSFITEWLKVGENQVYKVRKTLPDLPHLPCYQSTHHLACVAHALLSSSAPVPKNGETTSRTADPTGSPRCRAC